MHFWRCIVFGNVIASGTTPCECSNGRRRHSRAGSFIGMVPFPWPAMVPFRCIYLSTPETDLFNLV